MSKLILTFSHEDGVTVIQKPQRTWTAVGFSRCAIQAARNRTEFNQRGIYLLLGYDQEYNREKIYIGKGSVVGARLNNHFAAKPFWNRCVFFGDGTADFLGEDHIAHLEAQLIARALNSNFSVVNDAVPKMKIPTHAREEMQDFLEYILTLLPMIGVYGFGTNSNEIQPEPPSCKSDEPTREKPVVVSRTDEIAPPYIPQEGSQAAMIEAAITTTPKSIQQIAQEAGLSPGRVSNHVRHPRVSAWLDRTVNGEYYRKPIP